MWGKKKEKTNKGKKRYFVPPSQPSNPRSSRWHFRCAGLWKARENARSKVTKRVTTNVTFEINWLGETFRRAFLATVSHLSTFLPSSDAMTKLSCLVSVLLEIFYLVSDFQDVFYNDSCMMNPHVGPELPCLHQLKFTCLLVGSARDW